MATEKLVPVRKWAEDMLGDYCVSRNTLIKWVNAGKIQPQPIKLGREFFCSPDARYIDPAAERITRMANGC